MPNKEIFRRYIPLKEAIDRLTEYVSSIPRESEEVPINDALGAVIFEDMFSKLDIPPFDKALMDGYAVRAQDTFEAEESRSKRLKLVGRIEVGEEPNLYVDESTTIEISTGAPIPKGANAVVMLEYAKKDEKMIDIFKSVVPGENIMETGTDIRSGELILRKGQRITSKELGLLSAIGIGKVKVYKKPKVAVFSTGNELISPGDSIRSWRIFDINSSTLAGAVMESGGIPTLMGIVPDDIDKLRKKIVTSLSLCDLAIASGSTSAGARDYLLSLMGEIGSPGVIVPGISIKPGKPTIVAASNEKIVFCLPGNPTSALAIFHLLVRPIISRMAGFQEPREIESIHGMMATKVHSARGRLELLPVHILTDEKRNYIVHPTYGYSASITSFAMADGFMLIPENRDFINERERVRVIPFVPNFKPAEMVFIGSHCMGLESALSLLRRDHPSIEMKSIYVGSLGGINSIKKKEADISGIHVFDESTKQYNIPVIEQHNLLDKVVLVRGYKRQQGFIVKKGNSKKIRSFDDVVRRNMIFINRNVGSGTRILIDMNLRQVAKKMKLTLKELISKIEGYQIEVKSHSAVAAAVYQGRADVGVGIKTVANAYDLDFTPIMDEDYDFLIMRESLEKKSIKIFLDILGSGEFKSLLLEKLTGLEPLKDTGKIIDL